MQQMHIGDKWEVYIPAEMGYGKALLLHLVKIAREHNCGRMEWTCLNWNQPSIDFYLSLGAVPMKEWTIYRLDSAALMRLSNI